MCGRFLFSSGESDEIDEIIRDVERRVSPGAVRTGEVYPTNITPVLVNRGGAVCVEPIRWGFPGVQNRGVIINARSETAQEKPMFRKRLLTGRCVVPSTGFFEWSHDAKGKALQKYLFRHVGKTALYMAGLFNDFDGERRFVILTRAANVSMAEVHDRMPVILDSMALDRWLFDDSAISGLLEQAPMLIRSAV